MTELHKCPFCGGEAVIHEMATNDWCVWCLECPCGMYGFNTEQEAIEAWNKRTSCDTCALYIPDDGCIAALVEGEVAE